MFNDDFLIKHPLLGWVIIAMMCATVVRVAEVVVEPLITTSKELAKNKKAKNKDE